MPSVGQQVLPSITSLLWGLERLEDCAIMEKVNYSELWIEGQTWSKCVKLWNWRWYLGYLPGWGCHSTISWNMIVAVSGYAGCGAWSVQGTWRGGRAGLDDEAPKDVFDTFRLEKMCGISWVYHGMSMDYVSMSYSLMPLKTGSTWIFLELTFSKLDSSIPQKRRNTSGPFTAQKNTRTWGFDLGCTSYQISWWIWALLDESPSDIWVTFPPWFSLYIPEGGKICHYIWHLEVALTCFN